MRNKVLGAYIAIFAVILVVFNVCAFAIPNDNKYEAMWWFGYIFITIAILAQVGVYVWASQRGKISTESTFLNISVVYSGFGFLIGAAFCGLICMIIPGIPGWVGAVLCAVISAVGIIQVLLAKTAVDAIQAVGNEVKQKTAFIKMLTVDAQVLVAEAKNSDIKKLAESVYDEIKFSDPMSADALEDSNRDVKNAFDSFATAVREDNAEDASKYASNVLLAVKARNAKCKLLK